MITLEQYFGAKDHTPEQAELARDLLERREALRAEFYEETGFAPSVCPNTGSEISGSKGGAGDGGFRLPNSATGAARSSHKEARGVDDYDPDNRFDKWLDKFEDHGHNSMLEKHGLYREHPDATPHWCHLTTRAPGMGLRTFRP